METLETQRGGAAAGGGTYPVHRRGLAYTGAALAALYFMDRDRETTARPVTTRIDNRRPPTGRGREADRPRDIPARGWKDIAWRVYRQIGCDNIDLIAAGVAFYTLLALFPAIAALVSIYGLVADRATVLEHTDKLAGFLPQGAVDLISGQMEAIASQPQGALGLGFVLGLGLSIWGANKAMKSMLSALNVAYDETEKRGMIALNAVSIAFTLGAIVLVLVALGVIIAIPIVMRAMGISGGAGLAVELLRWPILLIVALAGMATLYRYGPSRTEAKWRWITPGGAVAAVLWIAASVLFSWYVTNFGSYNETYGSLGAVIVFMTWVWLSAMTLLIGAELNAEAERQTTRDSTVGPPRPMGQRGAHAADTLGEPAGT